MEYFSNLAMRRNIRLILGSETDVHVKTMTSISKEIDGIVTKLEEKGIQVPYNRDELKDSFKGIAQKSLDTCEKSLERLGKAIVKLTKGGPVEQASAVMDIISGVALFIPVYGAVISGVFLLISNVIVAFGGNKNESMTAVLEHIVEKVVSKYHDDDIKAETAGTIFKLANMQKYLDGYTKTAPSDYTKKDADDLASHDLEFTTVGTECLGKLEYYIKLYSVNKESEIHEDVERQARCTIDYVEAYLELSKVRQLLLSVFYCVLLTASTKGEFKAKTNGFRETLTLAMQKDREIADVIPVDYTTPEKAVLASVFNLSEHPVITAFKQDAVSDVDMDNKEVQLKPKKFPNKLLVAYQLEPPYAPFPIARSKAYDPQITCRSGLGNISSCFTLHKEGKGNNFKIECNCFRHLDEGPQQAREIVFAVTQTGEFYLPTTLRTMPQGYGRFSWKLIRVFQVNEDPNEQLYLIASVDYPAMFLTCASEHISVGDPGDLGYWYLDQSGVAEARGRRKSICWII